MSHFLFTVRLWAEKSGDLMQTSGGGAGSEKNGKPNGGGKRNGTEQRKFVQRKKSRDEREDI